jgi:hypothetical protein
LGIFNNKVVPDNSLTSSSIYDNTRSAAEARLLSNSSWRPRDNDTNPWLQIDLGEIYYVCAVATQGDPNSDERTTKYKIRGSVNNSSWTSIENKTSGNEKVSLLPQQLKLFNLWETSENETNVYPIMLLIISSLYNPI